MKFCMIGWCGHSIYLMEGLKRLPDFELAGITSGIPGDDGSSITEHLAEEGVVFSGKRYGDWREMLDAVTPEAVSIDGPFHKHGEMCLECAKRGIHVFCEKPVSLDLTELAAIEKASAATGSVIVSMVGLRYDPAFWTAHELISSGIIGKIKLIHAQKSYKLGKRPDYYRKRELYGGTIPWVGSHAIDWILWFTGNSFDSVTAHHDSTDNGDNGEMEIAGECLFRLKNGVIATISVDFLRPAAAPSHGDDRIRCAGTKGVLEVMADKVHLITPEKDQEMTILPPPRSLFEDFIGGLRKENPLPVTTAETIALTRACLLARESADKGVTEYFA